ncbi:MAG: alpha/beta fold hydrolase, partial [Casimicrobium sp.]
MGQSTSTAQEATIGSDSRARKPTFVLVHGAWHGGWCWSEVVSLLAAEGFRAIAIDLPGHGYKAKLPAAYRTQPQDHGALATEVSGLAAITLDDYRDYTLNVIRGLVKDGSGPVILVGHSLGGATLTAVAEAEPALIRKLVYLTAFVPVKLDSVIAYITRPEWASSEVPPLFAADPGVVAAVRINPSAADPAYQAKSKSALYGDLADDAFPAIANLLTPDEPVQAFAGKVAPTIARWGSV